MPDIKQVIVMRKDLNMRKGKMCAQAAHASIAFLTNKFRSDENESGKAGAFLIELNEEEAAWIEGSFKKICVSVDSEEELLSIHDQARAAGLASSLILDSGLTEFNQPTHTCVAIGPNEASEIDKITGDLKLL